MNYCEIARSLTGSTDSSSTMTTSSTAGSFAVFARDTSGLVIADEPSIKNPASNAPRIGAIPEQPKLR